jgi:DNA-binding MarR family transcriptional regulator
MTAVKGGYPDHIFQLLDLALTALRDDLTASLSATADSSAIALLDGLRSSQLRLLSLTPEEGMRVTDLAHRAGMTKQSLGEFAGVLEQLGLMESVRDPQDRRVRILRPTARGRKVVTISARAIRAMEARWRDEIGPRRWDTMRRTLLAIHEHAAKSKIE